MSGQESTHMGDNSSNLWLMWKQLDFSSVFYERHLKKQE